MSGKRSTYEFTQNQALVEVLKRERKTQTAFAEMMGISKQAIGKVYNKHQVIPATYVAYIIENHRDIAVKYGFVQDKVSEPPADYTLKQNDMNLLQQQLTELAKMLGALEKELNNLKGEIEFIKNPNQRVKIG